MIPDETNAARNPRDGEAIAEAFREQLRVQGFTLYRVAALSRARFPQRPGYQIRRNFCFQLRSGLSPTFQQVLALSELTGVRLANWLAVFGFSLDAIPQLQSTLPRIRTCLIDKDLVDPESPIPLLRYRRPGATLPASAPLIQLVERSGSFPTEALMPRGAGDVVYAKIGTDDALASPEFLPGSIVRADPRLVRPLLSSGQRSRALFLVEHSSGLNCGRLRVTAPNRIAFITANPSLAKIDFRLGTEARILGAVDLELRFPVVSANRRTNAPQILPDTRERWHPTRITPLTPERTGAFLAAARLGAGLSFRAASKLSRSVAKTLGDDRYFSSPGTLSDYEAGDKLPRHIHKLFTLAIVYGGSFRDLLRAFGIRFDEFDRTNASKRTKDVQLGDFFENMQNEFGELPIFLASALPALSGLAHISLRDIFWLGGSANPLHPAMRGALFVLVNRRSKKPHRFLRMAAREQPLYLLENRGGSYLAGSCEIEKGRLVLYAYPQGLPEGREVRRYIDADVVGQIVGIARSLLTPP
jgi:hypothetical protein